MEQSSNPEKKKFNPLTDDCSKCGEDYDLTPENTILNHYQVDNHMDNLICRCPHCAWRTRIFIQEDTFKAAVQAGIPVHADKYAPEPAVNDFEELREMKRVETFELTNRLELVMARAAKTLSETPDEHLYDLITDTGYSKPYALKWID